MAANKQPYALISLFKSQYKSRYGRDITLNQYRERWGFQDMIDSVGYERSREIIEHYFSTSPSQHHNPQWLFNNFEKLDAYMTERDADRERRAKIRELTRQRAEELDEQ